MMNMLLNSSYVIPLSIAAAIVGMLIIFTIIVLALGIKTCPEGKVMIIYGRIKTEDGRHFKCVSSGKVFISPFGQGYSLLDATPFPIEVKIRGAKTRDMVKVELDSIFTMCISTESEALSRAAQRFALLDLLQIQEVVSGIVAEQMHRIIREAKFESLLLGSERFFADMTQNIAIEVAKKGLNLLTASIGEIDENAG